MCRSWPNAHSYTGSPPEFQLRLALTLSGVLDSFLDTARVEQTLTGESFRKYRQAVLAFVKTMGDMPIDEVRPETFVELKRRFAQIAGPAHVNGVIHAMKRLVHDCRFRLGLSVADLTSVKSLPIPRRSVTYLTADESEQFFNAIKTQHRNGEPNLHALAFRALVEVLAGTGMRISEALALNVSGIRWRDQDATIIGKGGKERTVFFSERAMRWLRRYLECRDSRSPALFVTARANRRMTRQEAQRLCRAYAARSGIPKRITLHVLRHTFATTLLKNGCPIGHIQGLLGHDRLETTCRYYLGLLDNQELKKAHDRYLNHG